jgi:hypothetical protein
MENVVEYAQLGSTIRVSAAKVEERFGMTFATA